MDPSPPPAPSRRPRVEAALACAAIGALLAAATVGAAAAGLVRPSMPANALGAFATACACVMVALPAHHPHPHFGLANTVTLARAAIVAALVASALEPTVPLGVTLFAAACVAAALDAVDGPIARATGRASPFGARFDMEVDALLILALSVLAWRGDRAGAWVLASGALRYLFVAAARAWPWLDAPLPHSERRRAVCALQVAALLACIAPGFASPWSDTIAAVGLAALVASFVVDVAWLARRRHAPAARAPAGPGR
jgi:phosphatidylglycerophosphate synthase